MDMIMRGNRNKGLYRSLRVTADAGGGLKIRAQLRPDFSLSKSGLPGKSPGRPQSAKDTYGQETAGKRE